MVKIKNAERGNLQNKLLSSTRKEKCMLLLNKRNPASDNSATLETEIEKIIRNQGKDSICKYDN